MKQRNYWLLALLSILILMTTTTLAIAGETMTSGHVEIGISGMDTDDSPARVNEYVNTKAEEGFSFAPSLSLEFVDNGSAFDFEADIMGPRDQEFNLGFDFKRIFKFGFDHQVLEHWKDHDTLEHLGATPQGDVAGEVARVTTDATIGQFGVDSQTPGADGLTDYQRRYQQELDNDYIVTRRETEAETSLTIPALPNITFHAGLRIETREGLEQAITLSKCNQCHVQANGKQIDERTEDWTFGATGKFGKATIEYEYLTRDFTEDATAPQYNYVNSGATHAGVLDADHLNYLNGSEAYSQTPDSEKDSHSIKARVDINADSSISAAYVNAEVESDKAGDSSYSLDTSSLTSEYESFFMKGATRLGDLRLSVRGGTYEIDGPEYVVNFPKVVGANMDPELGYDTATGDKHYESAESRDVTEFGIDGVYRLAKGTTLRLGYEYENIDREEEELGETETHTFKVAVKSRLSKQLSGRLSYKYQNIDEAFQGAHVGIAQDPNNIGFAATTTVLYVADPGNGPAVYYWNSVYPNRTLESSMSPENVHEMKLSSTWTPSANMAATLFARVRMEENDSVQYEQNTYIPGASFYYAPNGKINLSMAYTFNKQDTENRMCVGWYHG
ncbi:MAG: MtrB/PioB family outer membrane beta-barrel protein [Desulfuromonadaceae bacterium]|nr:MtrB/PioB family outer membrane beta-barrel protein [Desulfuromonadaceae bacterium]